LGIPIISGVELIISLLFDAGNFIPWRKNQYYFSKGIFGLTAFYMFLFLPFCQIA